MSNNKSFIKLVAIKTATKQGIVFLDYVIRLSTLRSRKRGVKDFLGFIQTLKRNPENVKVGIVSVFVDKKTYYTGGVGNVGEAREFFKQNPRATCADYSKIKL